MPSETLKNLITSTQALLAELVENKEALMRLQQRREEILEVLVPLGGMLKDVGILHQVDVRRIPIEKIILDERLLEILHHGGILFVEDLQARTEVEVGNMSGIGGSVHMATIRKALGGRGLTFKTPSGSATT